MPCNSDYMKATRREITGSRLFCLLDEAKTGVHVDPKSEAWRGYDRRSYERAPNDALLDALTAELCAYCTSHDLSGHSLEMQMWWRDHQRADQERLEREKAAESKKRAEEDRLLAAAEEVRARRVVKHT